MTEIVLLGSGNVATHLFKAFQTSEKVKVKQVYNHTRKNLDLFEAETSVTTSAENLQDADLYILALKDDVIAQVAEKLKDRKGLVVHTSGAVPIDALPLERRGVFYPLQTFSKEKEMDYRNIPFCLEANLYKDLELLRRLAEEISGKAYDIDSQQRKKLHLSAVFVCNFVNHLYSIGEKICTTNNIPFNILRPLIEETSDKIKSTSPASVQTGPAIRNDQSTIKSHLELLNTSKEKEIYRLLTSSIQNFHGKEL